MKGNWQGYLFCKVALIKIPVKALEAVEVRGKSLFFKYLTIIVCMAKHIFVKDSSNTAIYLLHLIGF